MNKKINISIVGTGLMGLQHIKAIQKSKKMMGKEFHKIYGKGNSSEQIIELLKKIDISNNIIQKQITY